VNAPDYVVLCAYASLLVELVVFPIPSEASVVQLVGKHGSGDAPALAAARAASLPARLLRYLLPTAACVALFLLPLAVTLVPATREALAPWSHAALLWPGLFLVVAGRTITFWSVLQLRAAKRRDELPGGAFLRSRNPGLVGMFVVYAGLCLAIGGPWLWLGAPLYFANMHARVKLEEANLDARYSSSWRDYAHRVPRYLPFPGLR